MNASTVGALVTVFGMASLLSFGGGNIVLPELHRQSVTVHGWTSDRQFAALYAIAQGAPGPSTGVLAGLIGLEAGGLIGAIVAAAAILLPGATLMFLACLGWQRFQASTWRNAVEHGLAPVSMGLLVAASLIVVRAADHNWRGLVLTGIATVILLVTKINPLFVMAGAGLLGWLGLVR